jgi:hypothetical protein
MACSDIGKLVKVSIRTCSFTDSQHSVRLMIFHYPRISVCTFSYNFTGLSTPLREAYLLKKLRLPVCHNEKLSFTGVHSSISGMKAYGISRQIDSAYNPVIDPWDSLNTRDEGAIAVRSYPSCHCDLDIF